jgi:hypothetical protein
MNSTSIIARFFDDVDLPKLHKSGLFGRYLEERFDNLNNGLLNYSSVVPREGSHSPSFASMGFRLF